MWARDTAQEPAPRVSQPVVPPAVSTPVRPAEERRVVAWVGKSLLFRGDLIGLEDMTIDGRVEGTIELRENALTIGPDATVQADITAKSVTVHGTVVGTIVASDTICIGETGSVEGNITSRRVSMAEGAVVKGQITAGGNRAAATAASEPELKPVG
jgi:cytoskeletal protein CcmA (bactofilin family)